MYSQNEPDIAILPLSDSSIILGNPIYRKTFTHSQSHYEQTNLLSVPLSFLYRNADLISFSLDLIRILLPVLIVKNPPCRLLKKRQFHLFIDNSFPRLIILKESPEGLRISKRFLQRAIDLLHSFLSPDT